MPAVGNAPLLPAPAAPWKTVVFSHGLGGNRNTYSQFCGSLASYGYVVICPEHKDHTSPLTFHHDGRQVDFVRLMDISEPARDLRTYQLAQRAREIHSILRLLRERPAAAGLPFDPAALDLEPGAVTLAGHSFGAATASMMSKGVGHMLRRLLERRGRAPDEIAAALDDDTLAPFAAPCLLLLDPWLVPVYETLDVPLGSPAIAVMTEQFYHWDDNMAMVYQLLSANLAPDDEAGNAAREVAKANRLFVARPTVHHSQSDFTLLFPAFTRYALKKTAATYETQQNVMEMNVAACLRLMADRGLDVNGGPPASPHLGPHPHVGNADGTLSDVGTLQRNWEKLDIRDDLPFIDIYQLDS
ncbi:platelet-activating factor acetylhydrolase [Dipodascopsis tothii]|uniref:platelet-activating factor acetylhydrolase n=1 Tax=Dipodascopsis tothii TaxID=44089 RepID=UPI0034CE51F0